MVESWIHISYLYYGSVREVRSRKCAWGCFLLLKFNATHPGLWPFTKTSILYLTKWLSTHFQNKKKTFNYNLERVKFWICLVLAHLISICDFKEQTNSKCNSALTKTWHINICISTKKLCFHCKSNIWLSHLHVIFKRAIRSHLFWLIMVRVMSFW